MKRYIAVASLFISFAVLLLGFLVYNGFIWFNTPSKSKFPIRGIDVSNHQGVINWKEVKSQHCNFAFIKATEGMDYIDKYFIENWEEAKKAGIRRGAYHFFTFRSSGLDQAENFINTVPNEKGCLPPVIDIEFGGNSKNIPKKESLIKELNDFIAKIESHYGRRPILYVTYESYNRYIIGEFEGLDIWIRDIVKYPRLKDKRQWLFWQYSNRGRIKGIKGFVDLNVFNGDMADFRKLLNNTISK